LEILANRICGGEDPFPYRTANQLDSFFEFCEVDTSGAEGSRFYSTLAVLERANKSRQGTSGLPLDIESVVKALLDRREFDDDDQHADALDDIAELLRPAGAVAEFRNPDLVLRSTRKSKSQQMLDEQIHTVFGKTLEDEALSAARAHYRKAKRYVEGAEPDYENACKESVCTIESIVLTLAGGNDLVKALRKLATQGHIPRPIVEMIIKLYAYRGDEPGISHAAQTPPKVDRLEAELLFNLAGAIGAFMRAKLSAANSTDE
jgi:hypothetical protein